MNIHGDREPSGEHRRKYKAPTRAKVGVHVVGNDFERRYTTGTLETQDGRLRKVAEANRQVDKKCRVSCCSQEGVFFASLQYNCDCLLYISRFV